MSIKQILVSILVLTVVIGAYFAYIMRVRELPITPQEELPESPLVTKLPVVHGTFTFLDRNFKFNVNEEWVAPTGTVAYPKDIEDVSFAFKKEGTTCILAYANEPHQGIFDNYRQSSFSDRVVTADKTYLDTSWYVHKDNLPEGFDFVDNQTLAGEVRLIRYPDFGDQGFFLLFDEKGGKVDPACSADVSAMFATLETVYPDITLDAKSEGFVYIGTRSGGSPSVRFISDAEPTVRKIIDISSELMPAPFVYNDRIYYTQADKLFELDVFTRNIEEIPVPVATGEVINDFLIQSGKVYYLVGKDCRGYKETCSLDLASYDLSTKNSEILARGAVSRTMLGLDSIENKLYMRYIEGDAGCFRKTDEVFDLTKKTLARGESFTGCEGDPGIDKVYEEMRGIERKFGVNREDNAIRVEGRKLFKEGKPTSALGSSSWIRFSGYEPI